jgi:hypothetical protein
MGEVTHEQVNLLLHLYELRREPRMREARDWYFTKFHPASFDDVARLAPMGSSESASMRMVLSYWEMVASIVNRVLIDEGFFFENTGEPWFVWERMKPVVVKIRERNKNPRQYENLEKLAKNLEAWAEKRSPGWSEAMRQMVAQMAAQPPAKAKTAGD